MANISHFTQTVNGISTTYDIHDANAIPRSGGAVLVGDEYSRPDSSGYVTICGGYGQQGGAFLALRSKGYTNANFMLKTTNGTDKTYQFIGGYDGTLSWNSPNPDTVKFVISPSKKITHNITDINQNTNDSKLTINGGTGWVDGSSISVYGSTQSEYPGCLIFNAATSDSNARGMWLYPNGTLTWDGQPIQYTSDQRYKQQITEIDDKLLDAWSDVDLVQFKYNDAVDSKGTKARLHTGFVVQQIDSACKSRGVDISQYGLYCHEVYPEETEEVEVEQADGTKVKEKKVIREASEHYSLRYTEALIVECKYLRRCVERLTARIEQLEKGNNSK